MFRAAALAGFVFVLWAAQAPPPQTLTLEKVKDGLWNIQGSGGNVAVFPTEEGTVIVDDKFTQDFDQILANVKKATDRPVRYVINTHHHGDHTGSNAKMLGIAEVILHRNARDNMARGKQPGAPRVAFANEASLYLGGREVRARHFGRGHTNGDAIVYFPDLKTIHTGDLFVANIPLLDTNNGASAVEWIRTIDRTLEAWDFDTVIPGHGPIMKREDLVAWKRTFEGLREKVLSLRQQGRSRDEVLAELALEKMELPAWRVAPLAPGAARPQTFEAASQRWGRIPGLLYDELGK